MPDGRFMNPDKGYIVTRGQANNAAEFHTIIKDLNEWANETAGPDFMSYILNTTPGQRITPRIVLERIENLVKDKQGGTSTTDKPLGQKQSWQYARTFHGDEIYEALAFHVKYENDMSNVLLTHVSSVMRAVRQEQFRTALEEEVLRN